MYTYIHTYIHTYTHTVLPWMVCGCVLCVLNVTRPAPPLSAPPVRLNRRDAGSPRGAHRSPRGPR